MDTYRMTNDEVAAKFAETLRAWRVSPNGAAMTQADLAHKSGVGLTPLKRFEKTGAITLRNLIAILRTMDLLDNLLAVVPDADSPSPLDVLAEAQKKAKQVGQRAPRSNRR